MLGNELTELCTQRDALFYLASIYSGAPGRNRTDTPVKAPDFESNRSIGNLLKLNAISRSLAAVRQKVRRCVRLEPDYSTPSRATTPFVVGQIEPILEPMSRSTESAPCCQFCGHDQHGLAHLHDSPKARPCASPRTMKPTTAHRIKSHWTRWSASEPGRPPSITGCTIPCAYGCC